MRQHNPYLVVIFHRAWSLFFFVIFCTITVLSPWTIASALESKQSLGLEDVIRLALKNNLYYQSHLDKGIAKKNAIEGAKSNWYYPSVNLKQRYNLTDEIKSTHTLTTSLSISKVLFAFGRFYADIGVKQADYAIAKLETQKSKEALIQQVANLFYAVLLKKKIFDLRTQKLKLNTQDKNNKQNAFQEGKISKGFYLQTRIQWQQTQINHHKTKIELLSQINQLLTQIGMPTISSLKNNQIALTDKLDSFLNAWKNIHLKLNNTKINATVNKKLNWILNDSLNLPPEINIFHYLSNYSKTNRIDLQILDYSIKKMKKMKTIQDSSWKPSILTNNNLYFKWNNLSEKLNFYYSFGIEIKIPLFELLPNSASQMLSKSTFNEIKALQKQKEFATQNAQKEIRLALIQLKNVIENIQQRQIINQLALEQINILKKRYQQGTINEMDLKKTQLDYQQTQLQYYQDCYKYHQTYLDLAQKSGISLLDIIFRLRGI